MERRIAAWTTLLGVGLLLLVLAAAPVSGAEGDIVRVSVASDGTEGNEDSHLSGGSLSADGRFVAFVSDASNLVANDTNGEPDVFVHDHETAETIRVSVSSNDDQGDDNSGGFEVAFPRISGDGRYVAFVSDATNLVPDDTNSVTDVFVHDVDTGQTRRVSVSSSGNEGNGPSSSASISADGRYVAFISSSDNLVAGDTNGTSDVFVHDLQTGQTSRVSKTSSGTEGNGGTRQTAISGDGRHVTFASEASNLVPNDTNGVFDVFVHDRQTGETSRVSVSHNATEAKDESILPSISANGRYVLFSSYASNLVPGDSNGVVDAFVHDRQTGDTTRVSVNDKGEQGDMDSVGTDISGTGRYVVIGSIATNLVGDDANGSQDAFVHDRQTGVTTRVSLAGDGSEGDGHSDFPAISADGRYIGFFSSATNLVPGDSNGFIDVFVHQYLSDANSAPSATTTTTSTTSTTSTTTPSTTGDYFVDDDGHIFESAIDWLYEMGITTGCNPPVNDEYCPNDYVTRGQMAAFLVRTLGYTDDGGGGHFNDTVGHTFEKAIDRLYTAQVTMGCNPPDNDRYCPNDFVTRGQMAAFLKRAAALR